MTNSRILKIVQLIAFIVVIAGFIGLASLYLSVNNTKEEVKTELPNIDTNMLEEVSSPVDYSSSILETTEGFGRANPFLPYK